MLWYITFKINKNYWEYLDIRISYNEVHFFNIYKSMIISILDSLNLLWQLSKIREIKIKFPQINYVNLLKIFSGVWLMIHVYLNRLIRNVEYSKLFDIGTKQKIMQPWWRYFVSYINKIHYKI